MAQYRHTDVRARGDDGCEIAAHGVPITWEAVAITAIEVAHDISLPRCVNLKCFALHLASRMPRLLAMDRVVAEALLGQVAAGFVGCMDARLLYVDDSPECNIHIVEFFPGTGTAILTDGVPREVLVREIMLAAMNVS